MTARPRREPRNPPETFPRQPTEEHLRLEAFEGQFNAQDFISTVSEKLITDSKGNTSSFDVIPLINAFEGAVGRLITMRKDLEKKIELTGKSVSVAEREYSKKMSDLNKGFEAVGQSFNSMESKMSDVGRTAVRIGDQLETGHIQRERAEAARDLVDYYMQFSRDDLTQLDVLRKQKGKEGKRRLAILLRRLSIVAKEVDLPTAEETRGRIDKYCEKFEKDMLDLFDRCYRKEDPKMMHFCAQTLQDFNGGTSCIQIYVNQHDFFINRVRQTTDFDNDPLWGRLPDPNAQPPTDEKGLKELFDEIRSTVGEETHIVQAVFPNPPVVMQVFLQRIFAQSIQQHVEQLLNKGSSLSNLAFLRMLQLVHVQVNQLVEDLKGYEIATLVPRSPSEASEYRRSLDASVSSSGGTTMSAVALGSMLEAAVEELFVPYTEGQRYIDREIRSLGELYGNCLSRFTRYHLRANKTKSTMFDRMVNQLSAAAVTTSTSIGSSATGVQAAAALMKLKGVSADRNQDEVIPDEEGMLSLETAGKMLQWHVETIGRCIELAPTSDQPKHIFAVLRVLAEALGNSYIEVVIETAQARLEGADPKAEPNLQGLAIVRSVDLICRLWQQYVNTALLPLASSSVTVRREMEVFNNQTISRIEGSVNSLVQRTVDAVLAHLAVQLQKQKKNDFKPRNDDVSFARVNTEPCEFCCDVLEKVRDFSKQNLSGKNLEAFLTEVGDGFLCLLLEHFRKFPVNATGGLMLAKDLKSYQDVVQTFKLPALQERYEFLRQLGNIFLVRPEILRSYVRENYLGKVDAELLRPYLGQRSDWSQVEKIVDGVGEESGTVETKGLGDRLGMPKLSALMRELESLRPDVAALGMLG